MLKDIVNPYEFVGMSESKKLTCLTTYYRIKLPRICEAINSWHPSMQDKNREGLKNGRVARDNLAFLVRIVTSEDSKESKRIKEIAGEIKSYLEKYCYDHTPHQTNTKLAYPTAFSHSLTISPEV